MDRNQYILSWSDNYANEKIENISQQDIKYFLDTLYKFHIRYTKSIKFAGGCNNV